MQTNETFGEELEADLLAEGEKLGPVEKITVFPKNTKGPVVIKVMRRLPLAYDIDLFCSSDASRSTAPL